MNNLTQAKNILQHIRHFAELPEEIQKAVAAAATHRHFDTGQVIYMEGEPAESIYILESGWVKAKRMTREGREQAMMFLRPVEVFGDIAVFNGQKAMVGYYPGDVFHGVKHEEDIKAGDWIFVPLDDPASRFTFDSTTFAPMPGYENHPMTMAHGSAHGRTAAR